MNERTQCSQLSSIVKLETGYDHIKTYLQRIDVKFDELIESVNRMSILEEKHHTTSTGLERAHKKIEELRNDIDGLQKEVNKHVNTIKGMTISASILWTIIGGAVTYLMLDAIK